MGISPQSFPHLKHWRMAVGLACVWGALASFGALEALERLTLQARYALRPAPGYQTPVTIVAIDERSLQHFGQMPWDRRIFARIVDRLKEEHVAVVGIDLAFIEPARDAAEDLALSAAIRSVPTVLPTFLAFADAGRQTLRSIEPIPALTQGAVALGSIQFAAKQQPQIWEVEPYQDALGRRVPAFPVAVVGAFKGEAWSAPGRHFPWRNDPKLIDFRGPANSANQYSAKDVLEGQLPPGALAGHMVLVGAVATGLPDTNFAVPDFRSGPMSGVELSANVIDNLMNDGFLRRLDPQAFTLMMGLFVLGPGRLLCRGRSGRFNRTALLAVPLAGWLVLATAALWAGIWLEIAPVVGYLACCYVVGLFAERSDLLESRNQLLARYASDLASEAQRQRVRIEGELHDGIQQLLIVITRSVRQLQRAEPSGVGTGAARFEFLGQLTDQAQQEIKRLRGDLLPPALRHGGLLEALPMLVSEKSARSGIDFRLEAIAWDPLPQAREAELYWLIAEALNNAEKHAGPHHVRIRLDRSPEEVSIDVIDDGCGFDPPDLSQAPAGVDHSGLHRMWLRMKGNQGDLQIVSGPGRGTCVRFLLPSNPGRSV